MASPRARHNRQPIHTLTPSESRAQRRYSKPWAVGQPLPKSAKAGYLPPMPQLINPRHERFVRHWRKTGNAAASYIAAGYEPQSRNSLDAAACRLLRHHKVIARLRELERSMVQKTEISLQLLIDQLAEDRRQAKALGQIAPAIQATIAQAKLTGHLVERKEVGAAGDFAGLKSAEDVLQLIKDQLGDAAAKAIAAALAPSETLPAASPILDDMPETSKNNLN
jgi:phage terminase small subunit